MNARALRLTLENIFIFFVLLAGAILRIRQYLIGRSLWVDEAMLALNIVNRNFLALFKPLDYDQGAPIGFLLTEKIFNLLFGRNEYALRIFPLILGLLSLWTFYLLLKHFTRGPRLIIALSLFALNPRLIYYSSEVKQYMADVFVTITFLLITAYYFDAPSRKRLGFIALTGFLALWFSHPALFILAGIGITLLFFHFQKHDFSNIKLIIGMGILWLVNVGFLYSLTLGDLQNNSYMREYWQNAFAPMPPWANINWYWNTFQGNANTHFAVTITPWFLLLLMLTGWIYLLKQKNLSGIAIGFILFFTLLASSLALYPSLERMVLFLTPIGIFLIGASTEWIIESLRGSRVVSTVTILLVSVYLFYGALPRTFEQFISPKYYEHIRPTMEYLQESWKDGDSIYITTDGVPAFEYYAPIYGLENVPYISGQREDYANPPTMLERLTQLKGQSRVWVLMSHVYEKDGFNEQDYLLDYLKKNGTRKRAFIEPGTSVYLYLYDLSE